mmetsp:Transcript_28875/g.85925  ORF Transcript_28875/g.85925 Transcript_28875/m.85925 type:complete len:204 (+) Transcript_28875:242-853(+)
MPSEVGSRRGQAALHLGDEAERYLARLTKGEAHLDKRRHPRLRLRLKVPVLHEPRRRSRDVQQFIVVVVDHGGRAAAAGLVFLETLLCRVPPHLFLRRRPWRLVDTERRADVPIVLVASDDPDLAARLQSIGPPRPKQLGRRARLRRRGVAVGRAADQRDHAQGVFDHRWRRAGVAHDLPRVGVGPARLWEVLLVVCVVQQSR